MSVTVGIILGLLICGAAVVAFVYLFRTNRLGRAFKHRRMAENLVNTGENGQHMFPMETTPSSTNFVNPVYENAFGQPEEEESVLLPQDSLENPLIDLDSESSDLLNNQRHRRQL